MGLGLAGRAGRSRLCFLLRSNTDRRHIERCARGRPGRKSAISGHEGASAVTRLVGESRSAMICEIWVVYFLG